MQMTTFRYPENAERAIRTLSSFHYTLECTQDEHGYTFLSIQPPQKRFCWLVFTKENRFGIVAPAINLTNFVDVDLYEQEWKKAKWLYELLNGLLDEEEAEYEFEEDLKEIEEANPNPSTVQVI
jgi:hypothetical protein